MLRKLIVLAITAGLGKKAFDKYKEKNASRDLSDVTPRKPRSGKRAATAKSGSDKPTAA